MDSHGRIQQRSQELCSPKALFYMRVVSKLFDEFEVYHTYLSMLREYTYGRIDIADMHQQVSILFSVHPQMIRLFEKCFPRANSTKRVNEYDSTETLRSAKKAKIENDSTKAITGFGPTSTASTSYASNYSVPPSSSVCYQHEWAAVASCSSSSPSRPGNAAEAYEAEKKKIGQFIDGTLYVTETKTKLMSELPTYQRLIELINEIGSNRIDTYSIMENASNLLQGYPYLTESFNEFLPEGYKIVVLSDDDEMSTDYHGKTGRLSRDF